MDRHKALGKAWKAAPWLITGVYCISFILPTVVRTGSQPERIAGLMVIIQLFHEGGELEMGGVIAVGINFLFCIALCLAHSKAWPEAAVFAVLGLLGSVLFVPLGFNQDHEPELSLGFGYYCWVGSMILLVAASIFERILLIRARRCQTT